MLRRLGCEYGQGYYFSRPIDREEAGALLRTGSQQAILASA
jgi:EAL domain-containing protein (putative c-di-GMP-specific phosphodiesterase class I)